MPTPISWPSTSVGTAMSAVSEIRRCCAGRRARSCARPHPARSQRARQHRVRRYGAGRSARSAHARKPASRAIASTTAESMPPETSTTAADLFADAVIGRARRSTGVCAIASGSAPAAIRTIQSASACRQPAWRSWARTALRSDSCRRCLGDDSASPSRSLRASRSRT
jgi:hypothetical protein